MRVIEEEHDPELLSWTSLNGEPGTTVGLEKHRTTCLQDYILKARVSYLEQHDVFVSIQIVGPREFPGMQKIAE